MTVEISLRCTLVFEKYRGFVEQEKILPQQCPASPTLLTYCMQSNSATDRKEKTRLESRLLALLF